MFENVIGREGYKLLGWSFEPNGEVIKDTDIVDLKEDKTIYAIWEPRKYKFKITKNILINGKVSDGKEYIEFTFDENIMDTIKNNGLEAPTKDTDPELYDCLEFIGWGFNGYDVMIKNDDTFVDPTLEYGNAHDPYICAVYNIARVHVTLNANDLGYYLDEGAEDIEANRKKVYDMGYCEPGQAIHKLPTYKEPIPYKNFRFEKWWVPLIPEAPYDPYYKDINIAADGLICGYSVDKDLAAMRWNEEYVAHYEEDRYCITVNSGGRFYAILGDRYTIADDRGVYTDDASKFIFTDRLGKQKGGGDKEVRHIYALKGKTVEEALNEAGFEAPIAYDRTFLGWQQGKHPNRVENQYEDFNAVDFSKIVVEGPMEFTAVWRKKPLKLTFVMGPNMKYDSGREEFTVEFPARDVKIDTSVFPDTYRGSLYDCPGYEDPICLNNDGEVDDYNYEFVRWEDDEEFLSDRMEIDVTFRKSTPYGTQIVGWQEEKQTYAGLEHAVLSDYDTGLREHSRTHVFENGENFYVDYKGRKYADYRYGGDPYREEPYVFTPFVRRIPIRAYMFSPFPVFNFDKRRQDLVIGSGALLGDVVEFNNTSFSKVEEAGYHFAGWYQINHEKINTQFINFNAPPPLSVCSMEEYFDKGMPTIVGFAKPGLDTWFKYVQCTRTDDLNYAAGQWLKKVDADFVINRDSGELADDISNVRSKKYIQQLNGIDIIAIFTANLTLDAGEGHFADNSKEKVIDSILIDTITPIKEYVGAGYEVPTPSDASKVFAGWRLVDAEGNDVRYFGEHEAIDKDTRLVASYIDAKNNVKLTIKTHGAETIDAEGNVVEMSDIVLMVPQGVKIADIEKDIPSFYRKGYQYSPIHTAEPAWFYEYKDGEYSDAVSRTDELTTDTIIHLKWKKLNYTYQFFYEIDGKEDSSGALFGEMGQKLKDTTLFNLYANLFDFSRENQPQKGYKITGIKLYGDNGVDVTPETEIVGNIKCKVIVEPLNTTITFDANGGELIGNNTLTVPYASYYKDIKNFVPVASNSDLAFVGWIDDKGAQVTDKYRVAESYDVTEIKQAKFTAQWTDIKATLVFDAGEGKFGDGSKTKTFENVPYKQLLSNISDEEKSYEEPTLEKKVFDKWEVTLKKQYSLKYTKDTKFGDEVNYIEDEIKSEIVLKALYVDKTVTFSIKLSDPSNSLSAMTFAKAPEIIGETLPLDYTFDISNLIGFGGGYASGGTWVQTVKEGMTFGEWFKYIYKQGYRYRGEYGYALCGWKYEEPASINGPRKNTKDMKDVDMTAAIKNGDVFTPLMVKGTFTVRIDANGGTYGKVVDKGTSGGVKVHQESNTLMVYENIPGGTAADKISGMVMPRRSGYTLIGYSRNKDLSGKSLASNVFVAGDEYLYAIWSQNGNQKVQPSVNRNNNSRPGNSGGGGGGGGGGAVPAQDANTPGAGTVQGVGPESGVTGDGTKQFTQTSVSAEMQQQSAAQVTQMVAAAGISSDAANSSQVQQAVAEVQAGMNIAEQYAQIVSQITSNPSAVGETTEVSHINVAANQAYWHTDANGNVTLEVSSYNLSGDIKNVWQAVTNDAGQTGWYKFDANGYMQTGLVQDGACTYYLSEERGAGYGQMVCNQTITIGGLTMTFNASGALTNMAYSVEAAVKTIQDAAIAAFVGPQPAQAMQVGPATFLSAQPIGPGV